MASINTLKDRLLSYEEASNYKLMKKLPLIIVVNGRNFNKVTSLLPKPFSINFLEIMAATMIKLSQEIDNITFSYCFNDEIVLVCKNDQINDNTWYDNRIQKIASASAAMATLEFNRTAKNKNIELFGDPLFTSKAFVVPNILEAINMLLAKQQQAFHTALYMACFYELLKKYDLETVRQTIIEKNPTEKADILFDEFGIEFNNYASSFRRGVACYRAPKIININGDEKIKNKLILDMELPIFSKDQELLKNIFLSGKDIFREKHI